jgi:hypothetical protein
METKLSKLKAAARKGDWQEALRIASRFPQLGDHAADIKRGHEAHTNSRFYAQVGRDGGTLIAAGIAALKARYGLNDQGEETMKTFSNKSNAVRAAMKAGLDPVELTFIETAGRWGWEVMHANVLLVPAGPASETGDDEIPAFLKKGSQMKTVEAVAPVAPTPEAPAATPAKRQRKAAAPVTAAEAASAKRQRSPGAKYETLFAEAEKGNLPPAPEFSADTHKPYRKKLSALVSLAEAGDADGMWAITINPISSSPKALERYRNLATVAIKAKRKAA